MSEPNVATVTIAEANALRGTLEQSIHTLIVCFERATGASVTGIDLQHRQSIDDWRARRLVAAVTVDVALP